MKNFFLLLFIINLRERGRVKKRIIIILIIFFFDIEQKYKLFKKSPRKIQLLFFKEKKIYLFLYSQNLKLHRLRKWLEKEKKKRGMKENQGTLKRIANHRRTLT